MAEEKQYIWLLVVEDHSCDTSYYAFSSEKKAREAFVNVLNNYCDRDNGGTDESDRTYDECVEEMAYTSNRDFLCVDKIEVDEQ